MPTPRRIVQLVAATLLFASLLPMVQAQAALPHETFFLPRIPTAEEVRLWSSLPGTRSYVFQTEDPFAEELKQVAQLKGADRILIEVRRFPGEDSLPEWKKLAAQGVELVGFGSGFPTDDEIRRLNEAGFAKIRIAISYFPGPEDAMSLGKLHASVALTFAAGQFPRSEDKPGLLAIPAQIPLLFVTDYWPSYTHMDLLNLLPQPRSLRVTDMLMPDESVDYVRHIQKLQSIEMETGFDPAASDWKRFEGLPLTWTSKNHVPPAETLDAFARSGAGTSSRRLVIDQDIPLSSEELARLISSPLAVQWIHAAGGRSSGLPGGWQ
jgi:hypothetical protein